MKLLIILIICLACLNTKAQTAQALTLKDSIMQKSKNQKTAAWIMLGGGAGLVIAGYTVPVKVDNFDNPFGPLDKSNYHGFGTQAALLVGGYVLMGSSYFLFHASANHKRQAMSLAFNTEETKIPVQGGWASSLQPALTITIPLIH